MKRIIIITIAFCFLFAGFAVSQTFFFAFHLPTEYGSSNTTTCGGTKTYNEISVTSGNVSSQNVFGSSTRAYINGSSTRVGQYRTFTSCSTKNSNYYDDYPASLLKDKTVFMYAKKDSSSTTTDILHVSGNYNPG